MMMNLMSIDLNGHILYEEARRAFESKSLGISNWIPLESAKCAQRLSVASVGYGGT